MTIDDVIFLSNAITLTMWRACTPAANEEADMDSCGLVAHFLDQFLFSASRCLSHPHLCDLATDVRRSICGMKLPLHMARGQPAEEFLTFHHIPSEAQVLVIDCYDHFATMLETHSLGNNEALH